MKRQRTFIGRLRGALPGAGVPDNLDTIYVLKDAILGISRTRGCTRGQGVLRAGSSGRAWNATVSGESFRRPWELAEG